jgi:hypothetical protein
MRSARGVAHRREFMNSRSKKIEKGVVAAMRRAGIAPQIIYAFERTGFLLLEESYKSLSPEDKAEYDAAIDEYFAKKKG